MIPLSPLSADAPFARGLAAIPVQQHREDLAADTLKGLWRHRNFVLGVLALSLLLAVAALLLLERKYTTEAVVRLDFSKREGSVAPEQATAVLLEAAALIQGEARIIRSRAFARRVVDRQGLAQDIPDPAKPGVLGQFAAPGGAMARFTAWLGIADEPPASATPSAVDAETTRVELAVRDVMARLRVATENRSYLITIGYTSNDPARAARIANAFAEEYVQRRMQANIESASAASDWLAAQVRDLQTALRDAENEIAAFRKRSGITGAAHLGSAAQQDNAKEQQLRELTTQLSAASLARLNGERRFERIQALLRGGVVRGGGDLQTLPLVNVLLEREAATERELGGLRARFGERHPTVLEAQAVLVNLKHRIAAELRQATPLIVGEVEAARRTEAALKARVEDAHRAVITARNDEAELRSRQMQAQELRDRLAVLVRNSDQMRAIRDLPLVPASLIVPAEAELRPTAPKPLVVMGIGLGGGLVLGLLGALLLERRDQGLRTRADVPGARCIAMVPELPATAVATLADGGRPKCRQQATFDEAVAIAGAGVGLFDAASASRLVLVTSAMPGEGRSLLCASLGRVLAVAGKRVLIIDTTPVPAVRPPGGTVANQLQRVPVADVAPSGRPVYFRYGSGGQDAGLFDAAGLVALLEGTSRDFDVVLLEGAPVMLVADSLFLSQHVDTVLFVTRWAATKRRVVDAALRRLREHSVAVHGLVLMRVNLRRHARMQFFDECYFYWRERRFYEALSGRRPRSSALAETGE